MSTPNNRPTALAGILALALIVAACGADATENAVAEQPEAAIESIDDSDVTPEVLGETEESEDSEESDDGEDEGEGADFGSALDDIADENAAALAAEEARVADEAAAAETQADQDALDDQLDAEAELFGDGEGPDPDAEGEESDDDESDDDSDDESDDDESDDDSDDESDDDESDDDESDDDESDDGESDDDSDDDADDSDSDGDESDDDESDDGESDDDTDDDADDSDSDDLSDIEVDVEETLEPQNFAIVNVPRGVNLRSGPNASSGLVAGIEGDRILTGTGITEGSWTQVQIDGLTGWVLTEFLLATDAVDPGAADVSTDESADDSDSGDLSGIEASVDAAAGDTFSVVDVELGINIRSAPGIESVIIGNAFLGDTVTATGNVVDGWIEVESNGLTGWASSDRLVAN